MTMRSNKQPPPQWQRRHTRIMQAQKALARQTAAAAIAMSVHKITPQLSHAGFVIDPLGLGVQVGGVAAKDASASRTAQGTCLREYCACLNKRLTSVARDAAVAPESGSGDRSAYIHSSVICSAGSCNCDDAVLGVANLKGVLLNQGTACVRINNTDTSRADSWQLDLTTGVLHATAAHNRRSRVLQVGCWSYSAARIRHLVLSL